MGFRNGTCVFCGQVATKKNSQKFAVCKSHENKEFPDMKCACGGYLDVKESKYGAFFICMDCGPVSVAKAMSINPIDNGQDKSKKKKNQSSYSKSSKPREITVRSDEVDFI
jgi:hypothetical protein